MFLLLLIYGTRYTLRSVYICANLACFRSYSFVCILGIVTCLPGICLSAGDIHKYLVRIICTFFFFFMTICRVHDDASKQSGVGATRAAGGGSDGINGDGKNGDGVGAGG